ncbi:hypothetical protein TNCT_452131 [Trichonephila clavata]|uniref:Uncharacterized protein n=1 Tax=Trichonephila clavata TaxID=2740835 RepID=A0A8X6FR14_TRICU|nr:hypothetical protein TNCT_452131 [Trichonephila clavata]
MRKVCAKMVSNHDNPSSYIALIPSELLAKIGVATLPHQHTVLIWQRRTSFCLSTLKGTWYGMLEAAKVALTTALKEIAVDDFQGVFDD